MISTSLIERLLDETASVLQARRHLPEATYRLQFHAGFRFRDAEAIVPYLRDLGISDCYASPYLQARLGSQHGYDISDHRVLNPEIGSEEDYSSFVRTLHAQGMSQLLDVVPNHMGIMGNQNVWWNDVLENGPASMYAGFFDIDWRSQKPDLHDKVLLPILGDPYGKALESLQLRLHYEAGTFSIHYFEHHFPVDPGTYNQILGHGIEELEAELGKESADFTEYESIRTAIAHLPGRHGGDADTQAERNREKEVIKRRLAALTASSAPVRAFVERNVQTFNGSDGDAHSIDLLDDLLNAQAYRLAWWRVASDEINYRRFFDVNELAALSMEKPEVFAATHQLILRLLRQGAVNGLRIDHPDGLFDPREYLERLQHHYILEKARTVAQEDTEAKDLPWEQIQGPLLEAIRQRSNPEAQDSLFWRPLYVVVEKILGTEEKLPEDWPVYGTTGYEFLHAVNDLFVEREHAAAFNRIYRRWGHPQETFKDLVYKKKFLIMQVSLSSELNMLALQLDRLSEKQRWSRDFTLNSLRRALREVIACFEVYRSYINGRVLPRDRLYVERAVAGAKRRNPAISGAVFDFIRDMLLLEHQDALGPEDRAEQRRFVGKFQQVTAPVMAKGVEDTAFYVYNRLVSLNEVGGEPRQFGSSLTTFHRRNQERLARSPHGLSATATHDTKRGEDTRARIDVLSEMPGPWQQALSRWSRLNKKHRVQQDEDVIPDRNEEYFLYQTLIGAWPSDDTESERYAVFVQRIQDYVQKALHEAKVHTSWINPNPAHDEGVRQFLGRILDREQSARFLGDFRAFQRRISHYGFFNSLSQVLLKVASPGVPDVYQGTELWDFSLVDPDNRRPVDYALRQRMLADLKARLEQGSEQQTALARELLESRIDGRVKMFTLRQALLCRREHPELFTTGEYIPLHASEERDEHVCAFLRRHEGQQALAVAPRLLTRLVLPGELPLGPDVWQESCLFLPEQEGPPGRWHNVFTGEVLLPTERDGRLGLPLAAVFAHFPVALFVRVDG
jgi:(1->4)-alpha-D-glucan 1-alpha-D-glucosylmutase